MIGRVTIFSLTVLQAVEFILLDKVSKSLAAVLRDRYSIILHPQTVSQSVRKWLGLPGSNQTVRAARSPERNIVVVCVHVKQDHPRRIAEV